MQNSTENDPIVIKVVLLGDSTVGKTTLRYKYVGKAFESDLLTTLGAEFSFKFKRFRDYQIKFQIWDVGGQELYYHVRKAFYGGALGGIVLYDINNRTSFENIVQWVNEFINHSGDHRKKILIIGNKIDLRKEKLDGLITTEEGKKLTESLSKKKNEDFSFFETSALNGENLELIFDSICQFQFTDSSF
ncbi:MAG: Rab family GTPase [Candidatus Hodarchaeales archaeon]